MNLKLPIGTARVYVSNFQLTLFAVLDRLSPNKNGKIKG